MKKVKKIFIINLKYLFKNNKNIIYKRIMAIIRYIILLHLLIETFSKNQYQLFISNISKINLKIKGTGYIKIYNYNKPDEVYINGNKQYVIQSSYYFSQFNNSIELIWNNELINCYRMFYGCSNIYEMDLSNFNTSKVKSMEHMLYGCSSLISINLSNFDISLVTDIGKMFYDCWNLRSLDLSNWNTSNVLEMNSVFYNCSSLTSINLSNWNTAKNLYLNCMFYNCSSLTSLNLSSFDTSNVININGMFYNCSSLTSLDLSNFDTSQVTLMQFMFYHCILLNSLDLYNFNVERVIDLGYVFYNCWSLTSLNISNWHSISATSMAYMFYNCSSLSSLNISRFIGSNVKHFDSIFYNLICLEYINLENLYIDKQNYIHNSEKLFFKVPDNLVVCMKNENYFRDINYIVNGLNLKKCLVRDCSENWKSNQKKIKDDDNSIICVNNCGDNENFIYEYYGKCVNNCNNGIDDTSSIKKCKCELEKCFSCPLPALRRGLCTKCNDNYYQKENDILNIGEYINCYKDPEGYYLDEINLI